MVIALLRRVLLRACYRILSPLAVARQLIELSWRLRTPECQAQRQKARESSDCFAHLLLELGTLVEPWAAKLRRKSERWAGRGIVVVAGGDRYGGMACALVDSLRAHGCSLPIEVFHLGPAEVADCPAMATLAACEGVTLRDLLSGQPALKDEPGYGYAAKPLALAASSFAETLLLDADNYALADPTPLFDAPAYRAHGAVFWSDMYATCETFVRLHDPYGVRERPSLVEQLVQDALDAALVRPRRIKCDYAAALEGIGLPPSSLTQESGQLVLDKRRCVDALAAVCLLNSNSHRRLVYAGLHGDKDTFRVAFRALGVSYHQLGVRPAMGGHVDARSGVFRDTCFVQPDATDERRPLFLHFCGRHRGDDDTRRDGHAGSNAVPTACMSAVGRPYRQWPFDGRRGYMGGEVRAFVCQPP